MRRDTRSGRPTPTPPPHSWRHVSPHRKRLARLRVHVRVGFAPELRHHLRRALVRERRRVLRSDQRALLFVLSNVVQRGLRRIRVVVVAVPRHDAERRRVDRHTPFSETPDLGEPLAGGDLRGVRVLRVPRFPVEALRRGWFSNATSTIRFRSISARTSARVADASRAGSRCRKKYSSYFATLFARLAFAASFADASECGGPASFGASAEESLEIARVSQSSSASSKSGSKDARHRPSVSRPAAAGPPGASSRSARSAATRCGGKCGCEDRASVGDARVRRWRGRGLGASWFDSRTFGTAFAFSRAIGGERDRWRGLLETHLRVQARPRPRSERFRTCDA